MLVANALSAHVPITLGQDGFKQPLDLPTAHYQLAFETFQRQFLMLVAAERFEMLRSVFTTGPHHTSQSKRRLSYTSALTLQHTTLLRSSTEMPI